MFRLLANLDNQRPSLLAHGPRKVRCILATLLIEHNRIVPAATLEDQLWLENPPRAARSALHVYISQVRKDLGRHFPGHQLVTSGSGYVLPLDADDLDYTIVKRSVNQAHDFLNRGAYLDAKHCLDSALKLFASSPIQDLNDAPIVRQFLIESEVLVLHLLQLLAYTNLQLGFLMPNVQLLTRAISRFPLHEPFYEYQLLSLARSGRITEALTVFRSARSTFSAELGLEPPRRLREIHENLLRHGEVPGEVSPVGWKD